jgi:hypothetical protein
MKSFLIHLFKNDVNSMSDKAPGAAHIVGKTSYTRGNVPKINFRDSLFENDSEWIESFGTFNQSKENKFSFRPGQWVDFFPPNFENPGGYSISSSPADSELELAIREGAHPVVRWIYEEAKENDEVSERMHKCSYQFCYLNFFSKTLFCVWCALQISIVEGIVILTLFHFESHRTREKWVIFFS